MVDSDPTRHRDYASDYSGDFHSFCSRYPTEPDDEEITHLQDYLYRWVIFGEAVEFAGGNYVTYLRLVIHAIDRYTKNPRIIDYTDGGYGDRVQREVAGVIDYNCDRESSVFLDQDFFNHVAWQKARGQWPDPIGQQPS